MRWFAQGLIEVRRRVQRIGEPGESPVFSPVIFKTRYLQLARADNIDSTEFARLSLALAEDPELWRAWQLPQQLYGIYDAADEDDAVARIEAFVHAWGDAPIPEFRAVLKSLAEWLPEILAFHRCNRITNGRLEGTNNKLGVLKPDRLWLRQRGELRRSSPALVSAHVIMIGPSEERLSHKIAGNAIFSPANYRLGLGGA